MTPLDSLPAPAQAPATPAPRDVADARPLLDDWLSGRSPATARAYASDLAHFAAFLGAPSAAAAAEAWTALDGPAANAVGLRWRRAMEGANLSSATIARRLSSLKSLAKLGRLTGRCGWALEVGPPPPEPRRDSRGPAPDDFARLWRAARKAGDGPRARRDRLIIALLYGHALRRSEAVGLDLEHVDLAGGAILIRGKGRRERERITLAPAVAAHLAPWVFARGQEPGPLLTRLDTAAGDGHRRLSGDSVRKALLRLSRAAGLARVVRPHGLRHAAITAALEAGITVSRVRRFSRHAKIETVVKYDDALRDDAGEISRIVTKKLK